MGFAAPGLLPLLGLAAIPLIIHLLSRFRLRRQDFPSLLLLRDARRERFSWVRIKEIILLALRTLVLLALLLALTRPYISLRLPALGTGEDVVVVIDNSYSLSYGDRWPTARATARAVVNTVGAGGRVFVTGSGPIARLQALDRASALEFVDTLRLTARATVLDSAVSVAGRVADSLDARLVVITDLQTRALRPIAATDWPDDAAVLDIGTEAWENAGIVDIRVEAGSPSAGLRLTAAVRNFGSRAATRTVRMSIGEQTIEQIIDLQPRTRQSVVFDASGIGPGFHPANVALSPDSLPLDDSFWLVVNAPEALEVGLLPGDSAPSDFLLDALLVDSAGLNVVLLTTLDLRRRDLSDLDVLVVSDAGGLERGTWSRIGAYVRKGGSVLLMATDAAEADLGEFARVTGTARPGGFVSVATVDTTHPILSRLRLPGLEDARIYAHALLEPRDNRTLIGLTDRAPLMVETSDRRAVIWTITADLSSTDLVHRAAFVPLVHRTVRYLAGNRLPPVLRVGEPLPARPPGPGVVLVDPSGQRILADNQETTAAATRSAIRAEAAGIYRFESVSGEQLLQVAVNPDSAEGDLTRMTDTELEALGVDVRPGLPADRSSLVLVLLIVGTAALAAELVLLLQPT